MNLFVLNTISLSEKASIVTIYSLSLNQHFYILTFESIIEALF